MEGKQNEEVEDLKEKLSILKQRNILLNSYDSNTIDDVISAKDKHVCFCGGQVMLTYSLKME